MVHAPLFVKLVVPFADQETEADLSEEEREALSAELPFHSPLGSGSDSEFEDRINPSPVYRVLSSSQIPADKQLMDNIMEHNNAIFKELSASISQLPKPTIEPKVRIFPQNDTNQSHLLLHL